MTAPLTAPLTGGFLPARTDFHALLVANLPKLRVLALSLTRNRSDAGDLVQSAVTSALAARGSFVPGTNFGAWMYRILRNRFISDVRAKRTTVELDEVPGSAFARSGGQEETHTLGELGRHMARLPAEQRTALVMVAVHGMSYEEVAAAMDCAVGTAKCRVFRARDTLHRQLMGEEGGVAGLIPATTRPRHHGVTQRASRRQGEPERAAA